MDYPTLYKVCAELWIYMGLAWLSLFFSWNVNMVVEAHKVLKKRRRHRHRHYYDDELQSEEDKHIPDAKPTVIDIFDFPQDEDYSTIIKEIGATALKRKPAENINRSQSCSDILATNIRTLQHSPKRRRLVSISEVFTHNKAVGDKGEQKEINSLTQENKKDPELKTELETENEENKDSCASDSEIGGIVFTVPVKDATEEESVQHPKGGGSRFTISKVEEDKGEKG